MEISKHLEEKAGSVLVGIGRKSKNKTRFHLHSKFTFGGVHLS